MGKILRRILYLLNRRQAERDLQDEMSAHRELAGTSFGPELCLREEVRDACRINGWTHTSRATIFAPPSNMAIAAAVLWQRLSRLRCPPAGRFEGLLSKPFVTNNG